jgi:hypothetical protein
MSKPSRKKSIHGNGAGALTPNFATTPPVAAPDHYDEMARALAYERTKNAEQKRTINNERKRHAGVETLTLRLVAQLEQQVSDLRSAYFANLTLRHNTEVK